MNPSVLEKHKPSSFCTSEGSIFNKSKFQKEKSQSNMNQSPAPFSKKEIQNELESLVERIEFIEYIRMGLMINIFGVSCASLLLLWIPARVFGISLSSIVLICHSLLCAFFSIIHYRLLPSLIDETAILSFKINEKRPYLPAYHPSKKDLFSFYQRLLLIFLTTSGIWKYLSYLDFQDIKKTKNGNDKEMIICLFLGLLLLFVSLYFLAKTGPICIVPKTKKPETKQGRENSDKRVKLQIYDLLRAEDALKAEKNEEINKLRSEISKKDVSYSKLKEENERILSELQEIKKTRKV